MKLLLKCLVVWRKRWWIKTSQRQGVLFRLPYYSPRIYINNYLARKYAWIFVSGHYLFREANRFPRATVSFAEQIMSKWRLSYFLSFKSFSQPRRFENHGHVTFSQAKFFDGLYTRLFVRGHYLFPEAFRERSSRKIASFEEQIMSKDKY